MPTYSKARMNESKIVLLAIILFISFYSSYNSITGTYSFISTSTNPHIDLLSNCLVHFFKFIIGEITGGAIHNLAGFVQHEKVGKLFLGHA